MKNVLEVMIYTKTEITMKINSIIIGALMSMNKYFLIKLIKFYVHAAIQKKNITENSSFTHHFRNLSTIYLNNECR